MTISTKMTARQFLHLGDDPPGVRLELVDGEVAVSPSPNFSHSYADRVLTFLLLAHLRSHDLGVLVGDVNTIFGEYDVRRPDLIFISKRRLHLVTGKFIEHPPDLCVEIISPSSATTDRKAKFKQYEKGKIAHYWVVDPIERTIDGYKLVGGKYRRTGHGEGDEVISLPPFPDLEIPLNEIWWNG